MRRLEMLSNTIFGVAMTLLAYDLPKANSFANAPGWIDLLRVYAQPVIALMISFIVAGLFWFSHHRRLAVAPESTCGVVFLNLFLLLLDHHPAGDQRSLRQLSARQRRRRDLRGSSAYDRDPERAVVDSAPRGRGDTRLRVTALFPILVFAIGTAIAIQSPATAQFGCCLGFLAPIAGWLAARRAG